MKKHFGRYVTDGASTRRARRPWLLCVGVVAVLAIMAIGAQPADAVPSSTFISDGFEDATIQWSFSQWGGTHALVSVGPTASCHGPSQCGFMAYLKGGTTAEAAALWRQFDTGRPSASCAAGVWVKTSATAGGRGQLEIINPADFTYVAFQPFTVTNASWVQVVAGSSGPCPGALLIRIVLFNATPGQIENVWVDDLALQWIR
jgi:hypothetical protein